MPLAYPYHTPGTALVFPRDEGWHTFLPSLPIPGLPKVADPRLDTMEWVYANMHLTDAAGNHYVVFIAYFTQALRLLTVTSFDAAWNLNWRDTGTAWGLLTPDDDKFGIKFRHLGGVDTWEHLETPGGDLVPFGSRLQAFDDADKFKVDLTLEATRQPYISGDLGYLPFGRRGWFYYYSLTRQDVSGTIEHEGNVIPVTGIGWFDHQWGPFFVSPFRNPNLLEEYEWFSVQLDSGDDIVLTTVWERDREMPSRDAYGGAGLLRSDGTTDKLIGAERLERTHFHRDPETEAVYSAGWRFVAPEWSCDLILKPRLESQMTPLADALPDFLPAAIVNRLDPVVNYFGSFWEGTCEVSGTFNGAPATGHAFAELIKRYDEPMIEIEQPIIRDDGSGGHIVVLSWRVVNWDPGAPLLYRVVVRHPGGAVLVDEADLSVSSFPFDFGGAKGVRYNVTIEAYSTDHVLRGDARTRLRVD